jgi:DNA-binding transcriptional MerR regulator
MPSYSVRDVERVLRLSPDTTRNLIRAGFVKPARGARREFRFSFQDLIVLRTARALIDAKIPRQRIHRSLERLRRELPDSMPLSGLSISAVGDHVVVRDGESRRQVDSGQYLLGFDLSVQDGVLQVVEHREPPAVAG